MAKKHASTLAGIPIAEGVRFEIGAAASYAVRRENGDIAVRVRCENHNFRDMLGRIPFLRGIVRLIAAITCFFAGLNLSGAMHPQAAVRGTSSSRRLAGLFQTTPQAVRALISALMILLILFVTLVALPSQMELWLMRAVDLPRFAVNSICSILRIAGAVAAVYAVCRLRIINRLCMYRGAIAKVSNAYEAYGPNLSHEDAVLSPRLTDKSDGAFAIVVMLLALALFSAVRTDGLLPQLLYRLGAVAVSAAVANEVILPLERAKPGSLGATLRTPLTGLQHLFTIEPHNQMIEVAICAFRAAYENDIS